MVGNLDRRCRFLGLILVCQTSVHKRCHLKLLGKCPGSGKESQSTVVSLRNVLELKYCKNGYKTILQTFSPDFSISVKGSKLMFHIVSKYTILCPQPFVIIAALCCMGFSSKVLNVKVCSIFNCNFLHFICSKFWERGKGIEFYAIPYNTVTYLKQTCILIGTMRNRVPCLNSNAKRKANK